MKLPLSIIVAPDTRLKQRALPVERVNDDVRALMEGMLTAMHRANGIGLAAPQVGVLQRIIVLDISRPNEPAAPLRMVNPVILSRSEENVVGEEGCLSLPEHFAEVTRPANVVVRFLDETGSERELAAKGLLGKCIQHEIDHLDGVLFVDHLTALKRNIILRKLTKAKRIANAAA